MTLRRALDVALLVAVVTSAVLWAGTGVGVAAGENCEADRERVLCVEDFSVSDDELVVGDSAEFTATLTNRGTETATGVVLLYTAGPENETNAYRLQRVTLEPNESATVSRAINASTPGTHTLQLSVLDAATNQRFDASATRTVTVYESAPARLGGPIDRTEISLGALVGALLVMLGIGYRHRRSGG